MDTGARDSTYINLTLSTYLDGIGLQHYNTSARVCSGLSNNKCESISKCKDIDLIYVNGKTFEQSKAKS